MSKGASGREVYNPLRDEESWHDQKQRVRFVTDYKKAEDIEKLSGEVRKFHINDLPEEERKKYARR